MHILLLVVDNKNAKETAGGFTATAASAVLTDAGSIAMQGFYDAGETIAPVTTSLNFGAATECGEKPTTPPTPKPKPTAPTKPTSPNVNLTATKDRKSVV